MLIGVVSSCQKMRISRSYSASVSLFIVIDDCTMLGLLVTVLASYLGCSGYLFTQIGTLTT